MNSSKINLHIVSDSMADTYPDSSYPLQGWGMFLKDHFKKEVTVCNYARSGWTTKTFLTVGQNKKYPDKSYWDVIKSDFKPGDWLIVALGVNDCSLVNEFRVSEEEYRENLTLFVTQARQKGVNPLFLTLAIKGGDYDSPKGWDYILPPDGTVMDENVPMEQRWVRRAKVLTDIGAELKVPTIQFGKYLSKYYEAMYQDYMAANPEATVVDGRNFVRCSFNRYNKNINADIPDGGFGLNIPDFQDDSTHLHIRGAKTYASIIAKLISAADIDLASYVVNEDALPAKNIFLLGASKESIFKKEHYFPLQGWGPFLSDNVKKQLNVKNYSNSGWTTESYRTVDFQNKYPGKTAWDVMKSEFKKGDWILMTFGVNDASLINSMKTTEERFMENVEYFTREARDRGVNVVYMTPAINAGEHDSEDGWEYILPPEGTKMDENVPIYQRWVRRSKVFRDVAQKLDVPIIELGKFLSEYYEKMYQDYMANNPGTSVKDGRNYVRYHFHIYNKNINSPKEEGGWGLDIPNRKDDATHTNINGAREYAAIVSHLISQMDIELADYMSSLFYNY